MQAFALDAFGQPGSVHDLPEPKPGEKEVRVRVAAASINPFDNAVLKGYLKDRMEHRFPLIPCSDLAGTVDALGAGVEGLKAKHPDGVAAIIDTGSDAEGLARLSEAVRKGGTVTSMKGAANIEDLSKRGIKGVNIGTQVTQQRLDHLASLASEGKLKAPHIETFPLERAGEAFELIAQDHRGKLVVKL